jgi:hypothetical protein
MPSELARKVKVVCHDCERTSDNVDFHFLGNECLGEDCGSFNTAVVA